MSLVDDTLRRMLLAAPRLLDQASSVAKNQGTPPEQLDAQSVLPWLMNQIVDLGEQAHSFGYKEVERHLARALVALMTEIPQTGAPVHTPQDAVVLPFRPS